MRRKSMRRKSMRRKSMRRKSMRRKSMRRKSMRRKSMRRKSIETKEQKGGLIEDNQTYIDQRKLEGAEARLVLAKMLKVKELPLEISDMVGGHIKYEIDSVESIEGLSYLYRFNFLLSRLRTRADYIFFNNYINNLFKIFLSDKEIDHIESAKLKLLSIYPELNFFEPPVATRREAENREDFLYIGSQMDGEYDRNTLPNIIDTMKYLNKGVISTKLTELWKSTGKLSGKLSGKQLNELLANYVLYDVEGHEERLYYANDTPILTKVRNLEVLNSEHSKEVISEESALVKSLFDGARELQSIKSPHHPNRVTGDVDDVWCLVWGRRDG